MAANEIANIKMHANIKLMSKHFMVGRPAAEAGSQFYGKNNPLSSEGTVASELQMEFERISNHWHHKEYSNGNTTGNDLISKITCNSLSEYLFFFEQSKH